MKVLHIITGLDEGGAQAVLYRLVLNDRDDCHFVISLTSPGVYGDRLERLGVQVTALGMGRGTLSIAPLLSLIAISKQWHPDVIQTWMYHADLIGGVLGKCRGIPVVWGIRNSLLDGRYCSKMTIVVARICALLSRLIPRAIVVCAHQAAVKHAEFGYDNKKMVIIQNGYDVAILKRDAGARKRLRQEWHLPEQIPLLGLVARFDPFKDHNNLLCALSKVCVRDNNFCAVLIGEGVDETNGPLVELIKAFGLENNIRLLGRRSDIPAVMSALDMHVLASLSEAFPNVLPEAMACGTPCITTNVGDAAEIVGDTGWIVPPRDPEALAAAILDALKKMKITSEWGKYMKESRARVFERYSLNAMVKKYRKIWLSASVPKNG